MMSAIPENTRHFGDRDVQLLQDGTFEMASSVLVHASGAAAREDVLKRWNKPTIGAPVNCFLLRGHDGPMLVDAGTGTLWGEAFGHARAALRATGITPSDIRRVLLTHIHADHAAGLFDEDRAYFPNAEIYVSRADLAHFTNLAAHEATPAERRGGFVMAENLIRIYDGHIQELDPGECLDGIVAEALPGHTPGHTGYRIRDNDGDLLIWGDTLHMFNLQPGDPDIGLVFDVDPQLAARTRHQTLTRAADEGWTIAGAHVPGFARIERAEDAFRFVPLAP